VISIPVCVVFIGGLQRVLNTTEPNPKSSSGTETLNGLFHTYQVLSSFITWFVMRVARWVPTVAQELLTHPEHLGSPQGFRGIHVAQSLAFCVVFYRSLSFTFPHCSLCGIYRWFTAGTQHNRTEPEIKQRNRNS
jgi:hypothetical protein